MTNRIIERQAHAPMARASTRPEGIIIFWGSAARFSDWTLRIAEAEAPTMSVRRVEQFEPLAAIPRMPGCTCHIFFSDDAVDTLLLDPEAFTQVQPGAKWVLTYRNDALARALLEQRRHDKALANIGLLPMNLPVDQWIPLFRLALSGDFVIPARLFDPGSDAMVADAPVAPCERGAVGARLTPREQEVLAKVAQGKRNKTIAHELALTEHTIKLHLHHVMKKIGAHNRTEAAQWFLTRSTSAVR